MKRLKRHLETPTFLTQLSLIPAGMGKMAAGGIMDTNLRPPERFSDGLAPRLAC